MSQSSLVFQTLRYYWRTNLAVWLGVVVGTAVLGGALLVGDSVRGSLRQMTLDRLGRIDFVLSGPRFFREDLAAELQNDPALANSFQGFAPAILLQATAERRDENSPDLAARAGKVNVYGVDQRFWSLIEAAGLEPPQDDEVILSERLAQQLGAIEGTTLTLVVEMPAAVPRDSLLGQRDESAAQIPVTVKAILPEASGLGRLGLRPDQQLPNNAFVSLTAAQDALDLAGGEPAGDPPQPVHARCNALFVSAKNPADGATAAAMPATDTLNAGLRKTWQLADVDLRLTIHESRGYFGLDSRRMILEPVLASAARKVAAQQKLQVSPVLVYLANELTAGKAETAHSRYSVVAGVDPAVFDADAKQPFGPFEFVGPRPESRLGDDDVLINEWLAEDLQAKVGDTLRMTYHLVGSHGELPEEEKTFTVRGILKLKGTPAADRGFTPEVHGITDVETFEDWNQPFPMKKVTRRDDEYWGTYRATPKAFLALPVAQQLWKSRYGDLSRLMLAPAPADGTPLAKAAAGFDAELRQILSPSEAGLEFQPIKLHGLAAASGTTDFAGLFLGFSLFLIVAALALISLLFRLGVERRASQLGLLLATGFSPARLRRLLILEALLIVATGGLVGVAAAIGYASLMIHGLKTWWFGAIQTQFLELHVGPQSLAIGLASSVGIALLAVWWRLRDLSRVPVRTLLAGAFEAPVHAVSRATQGKWTVVVAAASLAAAVALAGGVMLGVIPASEAFEGISWPTLCFFLAGMLALTSGVCALAAGIDSNNAAAVRGRGLLAVTRLALRNAGRQKSRSVLTAGLIATATFLIVAIAAGQKNPTAEGPDKNSGNGGFTLVAESPVPVIYDLNSEKGRASLGLDAPEAELSLKLMRQAIAFRVNPGENASCLNIYQTSQPTVLGVPPAMVERGGFEFVNSRDPNPWKQLEGTDADGAVPVFGDMNTLQYSLHKGLGSVLELRDEENRPFQARVAGMLDGSIFQGVLLMSEANFLKRFPSRGYQYFLIDVAPSVRANLKSVVARVFDGQPDTVPFELWQQLEAEGGERIPVVADTQYAERILGRFEGTEFPVATPTNTHRWTVRLLSTLDSPESSGQLLVSNKRFLASVSATGNPVPVDVEVSPLAVQRLTEVLESRISGFDTEPVADRLANFLAVQNTYLSTFQTLGGLGLLLGTIGLATVMLRNVLERRSELALLRAVGFTLSGIALLVLAENAVLLVWGLFVGTAAALLAMAPHLVSTGADFSWLQTGLMLLAVLVTGMLSATFAVGEAVRTPILQTLRAE